MRSGSILRGEECLISESSILEKIDGSGTPNRILLGDMSIGIGFSLTITIK
jgi:hypothetical protein